MPGGRVLAENEVVVSCGGADHVIRWDPGGRRPLELLGHAGEREADDVLVALSGAPARCRTIAAAWDSLSVGHAEELLAAPDERLAQMKLRVAVTVEQRRNVQRRDDLSDPLRRRLLESFDRLVAASEVAALGPAAARVRAAAVAGPPWRRTWRRWVRRLTGRR